MTTKTISGTITGGYTLSSTYDTLSVTNTGNITGGAGAYGQVQGGVGGAGVALPLGGTVDNSGSVTGGEGGASYNEGGAGGVGAALAAEGSVDNGGLITGGAGGEGYFGAGVGGAGVALLMGGMVANSGSITGGDGAIANENSSAGGAGVALAAGGVVSNEGLIVGGVGGAHPGGGARLAGAGGAGVALAAGGVVSNQETIAGGAGGNGSAYGGAGGVGVSLLSGGSVDNSGVITGGTGAAGKSGGYGGAGVLLAAGGTVVNGGLIIGGSSGASTASRTGYNGGAGVSLAAGGTVVNGGSIMGGSGGKGTTNYGNAGYGVEFKGSGIVVNGSKSSNAALISGYVGVVAFNTPDGGATVINYGTIAGTTSGVAVQLDNSGDRLIAEAGSTFVGAASGREGVTLELASGTGTITDLGGYGTVSGSVALKFSFTSFAFDAGTHWTLARYDTLETNETLSNAGTLGGTLALGAASARLILDPGSVIQNRVVGGKGALELAGGSGTITGLGAIATLSGADAMTFSGFGSYAIDAGSSWVLAGSHSLAADQTLSNAGTLNGGLTLGAASDRVSLGSGGVINGAVTGGGGTLELAGGSGTITGLGATGTLSGPDVMTFSGFGTYALDAGDDWTLAGAHTLAANQTLANAGTLIGALALGAASDRLIVDAGADIIGAVTGGGGTLELAGGGGTISGLGATGTLSGAAAMTFSGFGAYVIDAGGGWTITGANPLGSSHTLTVAGALTNDGKINSAGANGIVLSAGGSVDNATAKSLVSGMIGVQASASGADTVTNFGTISGTGGTSVQFGAAGDRLIAEAGSSFVGAVKGGGGALELAGGGAETITGLGAMGTLSGAESMTFSGFGSYLVDAGIVCTSIGANTRELTVAGALTNSGTIDAGGTGVYLLTGGSVVNAATGLISGATGVDGAVRGTSDTVTNFGTIIGTGGTSVAFGQKNSGLLIAEAGSVFVGEARAAGGTLELGAGSGSITGLGSGSPGTVSGAQSLTFAGFGSYVLDAGGSWTLSGTDTMVNRDALKVGGVLTVTGAVNQEAGAVTIGVEGSSGASLSIAAGGVWTLEGFLGIARGTSTATLKVAGSLIKSGGGISVTALATTDTGLIEVASGTLDLSGALAGTGALDIDAGASLQLASSVASTLTTTFDGASATLVLSKAAKFKATIAGFAAGDTIYLVNIQGTGASVNAKDQLVVVNGNTTVATLQLTGNYSGVAFMVGPDPGGGTDITLASGAASAPSPHPLIAAMAAVGGGAGSGVFASTHVESWRQTLLAPRPQSA